MPNTPFNTLRAVDQPYEYDHFAGSQIGIYIGDVFVDEVNHIEFNVHQSKKPVYGYASQYYDAVASGQVLVTGNFTINFKESGYMHIILKRYLESVAPGKEISPFSTGAKDTSQNGKILRQNIERILATQNQQSKPVQTGPGQQSDQNPTATFDEFNFYNNLAALPDVDFENVAEAFEDAIWQGRNQTDENTGNVSTPGSLDFDTELRRPDQFNGFTIWIAYGDINNDLANHTIKKLTGVHIVGSGQRIEINGEPIQEQYEFIARNLL